MDPLSGAGVVAPGDRPTAGDGATSDGGGTDLAGRLASVRRRIGAAGGDPDRVQVVAVTKGFGASVARAALGAGLADLGENYAQELLGKVRDVDGGRWHFLGAVQRNKIPALAPHVALWHGIDRREVVDALARRRPGAAMLVEVDTTGDPARHGCPPAEAAALVDRAKAAGLDVRGLMTVAPAGDPSAARRCFSTVADLAGRLGLAELSMGMSDDFDLAVAEGSTMVRVGRALFGPRPGPAPGATIGSTTRRL